MNKNAFTLIEILVSTTIGVLMIALVTSALFSVRRISDFNQVLVDLHEEAETIHRRLNDDLGSVCPGAKWECQADPGADLVWNTGDEVVTLTWMSAVSDPSMVNFGFGKDPRTDLMWCRLRWIGGGTNSTPYLEYARNSGFRYRQHSSGPYIHMDPLLRRDRRRDLDDNDFRYLPGMDLSAYQALGMSGDSTDLDEQMNRLNAPQIEVRDFRCEWIDRGGWSTKAVGIDGISQRDANGLSVAWSGSPWSNATKYSVDGVYLDARPSLAADSTRLISDTRPVLLRMSFTLVHASATRKGDTEAAELPVDLSFAMSQELPKP
jgi:hypothetical protein